MTLDPRTPVLIGAGRSAPDSSAPAPLLMIEALRRAGEDSGRPAMLSSIDHVIVPQGSWSYGDPARMVAQAVGAPAATTHLIELGIPQQSALNAALAALLSGGAEVVAVVGGEARRFERAETAAGRDPNADIDPKVVAGPADRVQRRSEPLLEPVEIEHRLWEPVQQYALIDNALRAHEGSDLATQRARIAELWAGANRVAQTNPWAAFPQPMEAEAIATPSSANRPMAFPYLKWHASQWTVDQASALVMTTLERAQSAGVGSDRMVFPLVGLESGHAVSLLARAEPYRWPAMALLGEEASRRIGRPLAEVEITELYSCFPAAVQVQQRALQLSHEAPFTVTGGMAFAGGPFNNFVLHSLCALVPLLRASPGDQALLTTVSGLLTKPGLGIWSCTPGEGPPLLADLSYEAAAITETRQVLATLAEATGPARIVTSTVTYDGLEPARLVALCDLPDGRRCVGVSDDVSVARTATEQELAGVDVELESGVVTLS